MRLHLSALFLTCLAPILSVSAPAKPYPGQPDLTKDNTGYCVVTASKPPTGAICGEKGTVQNDYDSHQVRRFYVTNFQECAQRCFDPRNFLNAKRCTSFDLNTGNNLCSVFTLDREFVPDPSSSYLYWTSDCFTLKHIDDTPIEDGEFYQPVSSHGNPWSGSDARTPYGHDYVGSVGAFLSQTLELPVYSRVGQLAQDIKTCTGITYQLKYEAADGVFNDNYGSGTGEFMIYANDILLYSRSTVDGAHPLEERSPIYFKSKTGHVQIAFRVQAFHPSTPGYNFRFNEREYIDNVVVQAIYAGTLAPGTNVTAV